MDCFKIGVLGAVDSGKSTLIGVLKTNQNDDGRGSVRKYVMKHNHELQVVELLVYLIMNKYRK